MWAKVVSIALFIALVFSLNLNRQQRKLIDDLNARPPSVPSDEPFIKQAARFWAAKNKTTADQILEHEYGKVIYFPRWACVSLQIEVGGVGGTPVYCFDRQTGKLVWRFDDVE